MTEKMYENKLFNWSYITPRQREVIGLLVKGYSYRETAKLLFISLTTLRTHMNHIFSALDVYSLSELIVLYYRGELRG